MQQTRASEIFIAIKCFIMCKENDDNYGISETKYIPDPQPLSHPSSPIYDYIII